MGRRHFLLLPLAFRNLTEIMSCSCLSSSSPPPPPSPWASLPLDILELLLGFQTSFFDRLRFAAVCRSWRDAAALFQRNPHRPGRPSLPVLTFRDPTQFGGRRGDKEAADDDEGEGVPITRCFYSLSDDKIYRRQVPGESRSWRCFGSSHGWLAMTDLCAKPFLFNPMTGARVDLPSLATVWVIHSVETREEDGATLYMYDDPLREEDDDDEEEGGQRLYGYTAKDMRDHFIYRLVLSSSPLDSNCIAMAALTEYCLLAYTRPGDDSWSEVPLPTDIRCFRDIIYHDRRFYANAYSGETLTIGFADSGLPIVDVFAPVYNSNPLQGMYLVALPSGEVMVVFRCVRGGGDSPYETEFFEFYKLRDGSKGKKWVEVENVGDCCLFLGHSHSMSLPTSEVPGKRRVNCIYFTDDNCEWYFQKDYGGLDFGIYDIEKEDVERFCHMDVQRLMPPPMWLTPSI